MLFFFFINVLLWTCTNVHACVGWPIKCYLHQLCADTGCSLVDLPGMMDNRKRRQEREREFHSLSATWWSYIYIYIYIYKILDISCHGSLSVTFGFMKFYKQQLLLYIDLRPSETCHYKVMHRMEVTHSNGQ